MFEKLKFWKKKDKEISVKSVCGLPLSDEEYGLTLEYIKDEDRVGAIKYLKRVKGLGLKEAKAFVDEEHSILRRTNPKTIGDLIEQQMHH